jgi:hypothetical protein
VISISPSLLVEALILHFSSTQSSGFTGSDPFPLLGDPFPLPGDPFPLLGDVGFAVLGGVGGGVLVKEPSLTVNVDLR